MTCGEVLDRVAPFLEGLLPEDEARAMSEHLDGCESCRARVMHADQVPLGVGRPAPPRSPEFWGAMDRALDEAARRPPARGARLAAWWEGPVVLSRRAVAVYLVVLAAALGLHLLRDGPAPARLPPMATVPAPAGEIAPVSHTPVRHQY